MSQVVRRKITFMSWIYKNINLTYILVVLSMMIGLYTVLEQIIPGMKTLKIGPIVTIIGLMAGFFIGINLLKAIKIVNNSMKTEEQLNRFGPAFFIFVVLLTAFLIAFIVLAPEWLKGVYAIDTLRNSVQSIIGVI